MAQPTPDTQTELERREAALAAREAELARQQAELQAQKADFEQGKKRLLDNGNKDFVNPKEKLSINSRSRCTRWISSSACCSL